MIYSEIESLLEQTIRFSDYYHITIANNTVLPSIFEKTEMGHYKSLSKDRNEISPGVVNRIVALIKESDGNVLEESNDYLLKYIAPYVISVTKDAHQNHLIFFNSSDYRHLPYAELIPYLTGNDPFILNERGIISNKTRRLVEHSLMEEDIRNLGRYFHKIGKGSSIESNGIVIDEQGLAHLTSVDVINLFDGNSVLLHQSTGAVEIHFFAR